MRLKRLETYGFKSFADRLTFDFEAGITGIIGPNGCGKSNVVDAIKWVIGEQSAKAMRGTEMTDVIFNGCGTRRPMSVAEVTLTLDEFSDLPGADTEVALTRRLTRDGQSSYFINGKPSRLKDIRDLLMGTGIGISAYSVIEQGRIGFILESSTKERRLILEEASGISRYKSQRKIALRKLDRVNTDTERIGQVMGEVTKNLKNVRRQAEKALRYQELSEKLRELRMVFALDEYGTIVTELDALNTDIARCTDQESELAAKLAGLEASLSAADTKLVELDANIRTMESERGDIQSRRDVADTEAKNAKYRLVEIDQHEQEDIQALAGFDEKIATLEADQHETTNRLEHMDEGSNEDAGLAQLYTERRAELDTLIKEIDELIAVVENRKGEEIETLRNITRIEAELNHFEGSANNLHEREKKLQGRNTGHDDVLGNAKNAETTAQKHVEETLIAAAETHTELDNLLRQREEAQTSSNQSDSSLNDLRHEEARAETRHRMLADYEKRNEGISAGARGVLQQMDRFPGMCGLVADCFSVSTELELAIETSLAAQAQNIITETRDVAREAISFLKRERRGRATFLPLDDIRGRNNSVDRRLLNAPGVVGIASDLITYDKKFTEAFDYLLGNILILETLDHAIALRQRERVYMRMVTLEGDVVNPGGAMTGGRHKGSNEGGIISRKNEIRRLNERLAEIVAEREKISLERDEKKKSAFELSMRVEKQRGLIQQAERTVGDAKAQLMKAERDRLHAEEFASSYVTELEEITTELTQLAEDREKLVIQLTEHTHTKERVDGELATLQQRLHERGQERDNMQEEVSNLRVNLATSEERKEALRNHIGHIKRQIQDIDDNRVERKKRIAGHNDKRTELTRQQNENTAIYEREAESFKNISEKLDVLSKERGQVYNSVEEERQLSRKLTQQRRSVEQEHQQLELKHNKRSIRSETLCNQIREQYEIELPEAHSNWERPDNINWPSLRTELDRTEGEFARLGPVNLGAIDELREVEARHGFIEKQYTDLVDAAEKLTAIIDDINITSRKMFKKTYKEVRSNFQELFRKLYGGGKADLVLEKDVDDILEAGIDIIAQPPGKQPKSITLLSGGEKALTAIALLFAVYQTKPSPFCILDEVDAPLDESNTDVYANMVREFCKDSQFIVITHNKRTMQFSDALYGVTQTERGVSTKISVKLEEVNDHGELADTTMGAGPFAG